MSDTRSALEIEDVSGIVLAGGMSRRLGRDKALEPLGGEPLIRRVIGRLSQVSGETVVVVADMERGAALPLPDSARAAVDIYPGKGSLGGIFSGLSHVSGDANGWGVVVACDMPFLNLDLFRHMLSLRGGYDAVVPVIEDRPEPTHAVYSNRCLPYIEKRLQADDLKISKFFDEVRVRYVTEEEVAAFDPEFLSFFNINTQEDLDRALALVSQGK
jgi:molybdopterin-guanine dinucleotide biosynthesis protein A